MYVSWPLAINERQINSEIKIIDRYAKNFILTPANQATITPPAAINNEVPKSGCIITSKTGAISATIGKKRYFILLTS